MFNETRVKIKPSEPDKNFITQIRQYMNSDNFCNQRWQQNDTAMALYSDRQNIMLFKVAFHQVRLNSTPFWALKLTTAYYLIRIKGELKKPSETKHIQRICYQIIYIA
jgi:hypothetical protein